MGWGTFIAGRVLSPRRKPGLLPNRQQMQKQKNESISRQADFEFEVLNEITMLKNQGKEIDIAKVRREVRKTRRAIQKLGPSLDLKIARRAQEKTLAGEVVDMNAIEAEIINEHKSSRDPEWWLNTILWPFVPYQPWRNRVIKKLVI
jgi:hypothetical protein